jgi:hypothetical protein
MAADRRIFQPELEIVTAEPQAQFLRKDEMIQGRVRQLVREVGSLAVSSAADVPKEVASSGESRFPTLMHAVWAAAAGDAEARQMVESNARTAAWEAAMKQHIVMEMPLSVDEQGGLTQFGQSLRDVHKNALLHASDLPEIRERTLAEIGNYFLMELLTRNGTLEADVDGEKGGKKILVVSRTPVNMSEEAAGRAGFFRETMSCALQLFYKKPDGTITQESGFVAGRVSEDALRHDQQAIEYMLRSLGVSAEGLSATELLDRPLLLDSSVSMEELLKLYDDGAGGTFFGLNLPRRDYTQAIREGREQLKNLESTVQKIVDALLAEGRNITHPVQAVKRLHTILQEALVEHALHDTSIEAKVFHEGAQYIEEGRRLLAIGDVEGFQRARQSAHATSRVTTCPNALSEWQGVGREAAEDGQDEQEAKSYEGPGKIGWGFCRTPGCPTGRKKGRVGECSVCLHCQDLWDHGIDPRTVYVPAGKKAQLEVLMSSIKEALAHRKETKTAAGSIGHMVMAA